MSMNALYEITQRFTSEFAVRPYLIRYPDAALAKLRGWLNDPNEHVRRWISEGTRPRLPWGKRLDQFVRDPAPTLALLEHLKDDPALYVRKSVANHLNDIAKDHPELLLEVLERWRVDAPEGRQWVIRHALRTLVKAGNRRALALLGYDADRSAVQVTHLACRPSQLKLGETFTLELTLRNPEDAACEIVIDFVIHFVKAKGKTSAKVFKWTTATLTPQAAQTWRKQVAVRPITTRVHYPGWHALEIQVNGKKLAGTGFELAI
jgi:3-methyladenine DNA glycosylase AlkC